MKNIWLFMGIVQFGTGIIDFFVDYDKYTFLWLITGVLFIIIGLFLIVIEKIEANK